MQQNAALDDLTDSMFFFVGPLIRSTLRAVIGWLDDRGQAPIMRQHINDGTHKFLADEDEYRGRSALEDILGVNVVAAEDDDNADGRVGGDMSLLEDSSVDHSPTHTGAAAKRRRSERQ